MARSRVMPSFGFAVGGCADGGFADGGCADGGFADGGWRMAEGGGRRADGGGRMADGGWQMAETWAGVAISESRQQRSCHQRSRQRAKPLRGHVFRRRDRRSQSAEESHEIQQVVDVERLLEDDRRLEVFVRGLEFVAGDDDDGRLFALRAEPAQPFAAVHARHGEIEDDELNVGIGFDERDGLLTVECDEDFEAIRSQQFPVVTDELLVVVDDEQLAELERSSARANQFGYSYEGLQKCDVPGGAANG